MKPFLDLLMAVDLIGFYVSLRVIGNVLRRRGLIR